MTMTFTVGEEVRVEVKVENNQVEDNFWRWYVEKINNGDNEVKNWVAPLAKADLPYFHLESLQ